MRFGSIDHIILFGGSRALAELSKDISERGDYRLSVYSCDRQLDESIYADGSTLSQFLDKYAIPYRSISDINLDPELPQEISVHTLGIGLGEVWEFSTELIAKFSGRLLDLMGIRLPQYRGGAHYTWQIMRKNRIGCCNLQFINEETVQGVFDSGEIVKSREYFFPESSRIPNDYFEVAVQEEVSFLNEFLDEVKSGKEFYLTRLQENFSIYFPRLYTPIHGLIDWSWDTGDIETFICAFDSPYVGASTFINGQQVYLKKCFSECNDGIFHPFQCGLIYKVANDAVYIATKSGTLIVKQVLDSNGASVMPNLRVGLRFITPREHLEKALLFSAVYTDQGLNQATEA